MLYPSKSIFLFLIILALSLALLGNGCGLANGNLAKAGASGVRGTALIGGVSTSPVVVPYAVITAQVLSLAGDDPTSNASTANLTYIGPIAQAQADGLGRFVLPLQAGTYLIAATNVQASPSTQATPVTVTVTNASYKQVTLLFPASP